MRDNVHSQGSCVNRVGARRARALAASIPRHNRKLHRQPRKRLAIQLCVDRLVIQRLAHQRSVSEVYVFLAQVASTASEDSSIAQAALRRQDEHLKLVPEEVRLSVILKGRRSASFGQTMTSVPSTWRRCAHSEARKV